MKNKKSPEPTVRTIDTQAYLTVLRELVEDGNSVSLNVSGMSMFPFLEHERVILYFIREVTDSTSCTGSIR